MSQKHFNFYSLTEEAVENIKSIHKEHQNKHLPTGSINVADWEEDGLIEKVDLDNYLSDAPEPIAFVACVNKTPAYLMIERKPYYQQISFNYIQMGVSTAIDTENRTLCIKEGVDILQKNLRELNMSGIDILTISNDLTKGPDSTSLSMELASKSQGKASAGTGSRSKSKTLSTIHLALTSMGFGSGGQGDVGQHYHKPLRL